MMDTRHIADNLKVFRKAQGLTQSELASKVGVSVQSIKKMEAGQCPTESRVLLAIAGGLEVAVTDLLQPLMIPEQVYFRCQKKMKEPRILLYQVSKWLRNYENIENIQQDHVPWKLAGILLGGEPEQLAGDAREQLGISPHEPILDICGLLDKAGVKLCFLESNSEGFFGMSLRDRSGNPAIVVNVHPAITTERKIFSAAHELGHVLMHFQEFRTFDLKDRVNPVEEQEANAFASAFLMPREVFLRKWQESGGYNFYDRIMCTKQYFQVSYQAVMKRLESLGYPRLFGSMCSEIRSIYERKNGKPLPIHKEPNPMRACVFMEKRFRRLVFEALAQENITASRAAEMLGVPLTEVLNITSETSEVK